MTNIRTTLRDIANATGMSISAVSLVLNGKQNRLSEDKRRLIIETSESLNYRPNQIALGLKTRQTKTLGLILPDISNLFFSELAKGVDDEARKEGFNIILCNTGDNADLELDYINILADKGVDGIILASLAGEPDNFDMIARLLMKKNIPTVLVDSFASRTDFRGVGFDNRLGGYLAIMHLAGLGHKKIGIVKGPRFSISSHERMEGVMQALSDSDIDLRPEFVFTGDYQVKSGNESLKELIPAGVTAIFAFNDMMAYGIYKEIKNFKLEIPRDISVVGFDDIMFSDMLEVPLTTIRQPFREMGFEACRQVIMEIRREPANNRKIIFEPELIIRNSTRAIRDH